MDFDIIWKYKFSCSSDSFVLNIIKAYGSDGFNIVLFQMTKGDILSKDFRNALSLLLYFVKVKQCKCSICKQICQSWTYYLVQQITNSFRAKE